MNGMGPGLRGISLPFWCGFKGDKLTVSCFNNSFNVGHLGAGVGGGGRGGVGGGGGGCQGMHRLSTVFQSRHRGNLCRVFPILITNFHDLHMCGQRMKHITSRLF